MSQIALIRVTEQDAYRIEHGLNLAFSALGLESLFSKDEKILIKPNLLSAVGPERAVTPHPAVFEGLIRSLIPQHLTITYGDSPAVHSTQSAAKASGLAAVADRYKVQLADFHQAVTFELPGSIRLRQISLAQSVADADGLINLCKLKTHALTGMTGAIKNLYGVISGTKKAQLHVQFPDTYSFTKMLAELNTAIKPRLHIMDAIIGMEGNGPMNGTPRQVGWIIVSTDPVAVDTAGALIMGFSPQELSVITAAETAGLGSAKPEDIQAIVIDPDDQSVAAAVTLASLKQRLEISDYKRPHLASSLMTRLTKIGSPVLRRYILSRPAITANACTRCGQCVTACPVSPKALKQENARSVPVYAYDRCIRCYCCQEICPFGAIAVEQSPLMRLISRSNR